MNSEELRAQFVILHADVRDDISEVRGAVEDIFRLVWDFDDIETFINEFRILKEIEQERNQLDAFLLEKETGGCKVVYA